MLYHICEWRERFALKSKYFELMPKTHIFNWDLESKSKALYKYFIYLYWYKIELFLIKKKVWPLSFLLKLGFSRSSSIYFFIKKCIINWIWQHNWRYLEYLHSIFLLRANLRSVICHFSEFIIWIFPLLPAPRCNNQW